MFFKKFSLCSACPAGERGPGLLSLIPLSSPVLSSAPPELQWEGDTRPGGTIFLPNGRHGLFGVGGGALDWEGSF